jgi:hypothetical protein
MIVEIVFPHFDNHSYLEISDKETGKDILYDYQQENEDGSEQLWDISREFKKACEKIMLEYGKKMEVKLKELGVIPQDAEVETYDSMER